MLFIRAGASMAASILSAERISPSSDWTIRQTRSEIKTTHLGYSIFIINDRMKMENEINGIPGQRHGRTCRDSEENIMTIVLNANPHESPELRYAFQLPA